jgi:putative intracellular protease/amidase
VNIAIPIFDQLTALDAVGPYEVLSRLPNARVHFIAAEPGPKRTETEMLALTADRALDELPNPEVIVFPGGYGTRSLTEDETMLGWLRAAHEGSDWTTSVCTGALVLGAAGILDAAPSRTWSRRRVTGAVPTGHVTPPRPDPRDQVRPPRAHGLTMTRVRAPTRRRPPRAPARSRA